MKSGNDRPIILGDWGTSRLRLFLIEGEHVIDRSDGPGIGALTVMPIEVLRTALAPWLSREPRHVTLCGMAGSRNGLIEVPYTQCPATSAGWAREAVDIMVEGVRVTIVPGLACNGAWRAPDVMRGEETQIFGALQREPGLAVGRHLLILPGTHSKWAVIEGGAVVRFQTFITGEFFALLRDHSTLTRAGESDTDRDAGFEAGLGRTEAGLTGAMFEARSAQLREGRSRGWALGFLSGLLIGREISDALPALGETDGLTVIGDSALTALYRRALVARGRRSLDLDGDACSIAGLLQFETIRARMN